MLMSTAQSEQQIDSYFIEAQNVIVSMLSVLVHGTMLRLGVWFSLINVCGLTLFTAEM